VTTFRTFPDIEALAAYAIRQASTTLGSRVYSSIPKNPTWPLAVVTRIGGIPPVREALDMANVQVDVWAGSKSEARIAAEAARRALLGMEGTSYTAGGSVPATGFVTAVEDSLGLTFLPDPETSRDRYTFAVNVFFH
jgi:hypothetical protein